MQFNGNTLRWFNFWACFNDAVHSRHILCNTTKFQYLLQAVQGEPRRILNALEITNANYEIAIQHLKSMYDDREEEERLLWEQFTNLLSPPHKFAELSNFHAAYGNILLQLERTTDGPLNMAVIKRFVQ